MRRLVWVLLLGACESSASVTVPDATDTAVACDFSSCDDQDPCTDDFCDTDGTCLHVARNPFSACLTDAHCDDDDPCTVDTCALDDCGLMRCARLMPDPACRPCVFGCDDGNACTDDACRADDICTHTLIDATCEPLCNPAAFGVSAALGFDAGITTAYRGTVRPSAGTQCDGGACRCSTTPSLFDDSASVSVEMRSVSSVDAPFTCQVDACEGAATCAPMIAGERYVVWGLMRYVSPFEAPGADVPARPPSVIDGFDVQGFCLSTFYASDLYGEYAGTFTRDDETAAFTARFDVSEVLGPVLALDDCDACVSLGLVAPQVVAMGTPAGVVTFHLALVGGEAEARLFAHRNSLSGAVRALAGDVLGTLTLERVSP